MTHDTLAAHIDRHSCRIRGISYRFRLRWAAAEAHGELAPARHLLRVEATAEGAPGEDVLTLHVLAWTDQAGDIPALLTDALHHHLTAQGVESAPAQVSA